MYVFSFNLTSAPVQTIYHFLHVVPVYLRLLSYDSRLKKNNIRLNKKLIYNLIYEDTPFE